MQRKIAGEFLEKFVARTKTLRSGDPQDHRTIIGPLITPAAVKLVDDRVKEAVSKGATLHTGGVFEGQIYQPTILSNVPLDAAVANEETFGPVVVVEVVDSADEAVEAANRTLYGLTSSILAGDTYKAFELAPKVLAGIVNINSPTVNDEIHAPMGGVRRVHSGARVRADARERAECACRVRPRLRRRPRHACIPRPGAGNTRTARRGDRTVQAAGVQPARRSHRATRPSVGETHQRSHGARRAAHRGRRRRAAGRSSEGFLGTVAYRLATTSPRSVVVVPSKQHLGEVS